MRKHKNGFYFTHTKIEKAEELNFHGDRMVFQYWYLGKKIMAVLRMK